MPSVARRTTAACLLVTLLVAWPVSSSACPFCSAVARTFAEQMDGFDIVVIASLESKPESEDEVRLPRADFRIVDFLKGRETFETDVPMEKTFVAIVVSRKHEIGDHFLVMGNGTRQINWSTPMKVSDRVVEYLKQLDELPEKGPVRLAFFARHFEDDEAVLANDSYDEFARASYQEVKDTAEHFDREKLLGWLQDPEVMKSRKRLYYTLLGVCGGEQEVPFLEEIIRSGDRDRQSGLDALLACYLTLTGDDGVALVEETFLANPKAEYIDVFSAIAALRFHGTEADRVSKERIVSALRHVLDRPKMADMVIPDLARWEDWSVMDRLVQMFREADTDDTKWVRTPIISYLQACPDEKATEYITELKEIDPEAVQRAEMLAELDWEDDEDWGDEDETDDDETDDETADVAGDTTGAEPSGDDSDDGDSTPSATPQPGNEGGDHADSSTDTVVALKPALPGNVSAATGDLPPAEGGANRGQASYVSTSRPDSDVADPLATASDQSARSVQSAPPIAIVNPSNPSSAVMIIIAFLVCVLLFALLWSVLNGWFERLIF